MDLMFRAAYEDREREEQKEEKLIGHKMGQIIGSLAGSKKQLNQTPPGTFVELGSTIELNSPTKNH
jgi:hypothetical protein